MLDLIAGMTDQALLDWRGEFVAAAKHLPWSRRQREIVRAIDAELRYRGVAK